MLKVPEKIVTIKEKYMGKTLKELTLLDKFLFDQTMDIPEAHEAGADGKRIPDSTMAAFHPCGCIFNG